MGDLSRSHRLRLPWRADAVAGFRVLSAIEKVRGRGPFLLSAPRPAESIRQKEKRGPVLSGMRGTALGRVCWPADVYYALNSCH